MRTHNIYNNKQINNRLIKDGFIYLFRGDTNGKKYFKSKLYDKNIKLGNLNIPFDVLAQDHTDELDTPFISLTSSVIAASMYSNMNKIYLIRIPVSDIYVYRNQISTLEEEYLIADYISNEEIIKEFDFDDIKSIYEYLLGTIGLKIVPRDIGVPYDNIDDLKMVALYKLVSKFMYLNISEEELYNKYIENLFKRKKEKLEYKTDYTIDRTHNLYEDGMVINPNLVKDGYIYLFKEYEPGDEFGIESEIYKSGRRVCDIDMSIFDLLNMQETLGICSFIKLTSSIVNASCDSTHSKIILVKIPLNDIVTLNDFNSYYVPDKIENKEIVQIFNDLEIKKIYNFLISKIGLSISPRDIDIQSDYIEAFSEEKLKELKDELNSYEQNFMKMFGF